MPILPGAWQYGLRGYLVQTEVSYRSEMTGPFNKGETMINQTFYRVRKPVLKIFQCNKHF